MRKLIFIMAGLLAAAEAPPTDLSDAVKVRLLGAQRDYQIVKAQLDLQLASHPATRQLQDAMKTAEEACLAIGKKVNYEAARCEEIPKSDPPNRQK